MSGNEYIIEEIETSEVPENELSEFVEVPTVSQEDIEDYTDSDDESDSSDESMEPKPSTSSAKNRKKKSKSSIKSRSSIVKKFMNKEISYDEYARNMGTVDDDEENDEDESEDEESDTSENTIIGKIKQQGKRHAIKAESHHAKKTKRALPPALQGLMGQANLCYAQGDVELAEKLCLEIIRQEPTASEPYLTMAQIYENSDEEKYHELLLIAAM
jgi:general transcription factor 3C polypeptide 3 (transcription factor C subunit 4)